MTTAAAIERVYREEYGRVLASLIGVFRDFQVAEDALQDALVVALERWPREGIPNTPAAWLTTAARRKAIDKLRRDKRHIGGDDELERMPMRDAHDSATGDDAMDTETFRDERLKLIFTCCHPALAPEAQVALTLRTLGGLTTEEIAHAFLVPVPAMAQRLVRAQRKIRDAGIPYEVPAENALGERMGTVMSVLYLIFNEGYDASFGVTLVRDELCGEAIQLARLLVRLIDHAPTNTALLNFRAEAMGLLALMLLHHARRLARATVSGELVLLAEQDRTQWNHAEIAEGAAALEFALRLGHAGPYQIQAAIAALHAQAPRAEDTDWQQIAGLYAELTRVAPSPVVSLNHAVAVAMADGPLAGLMMLDRLQLQEPLDDYHFFHAARADLLRRLGMNDEAVTEYERALSLCQNASEQTFLKDRLATLRPEIENR